MGGKAPGILAQGLEHAANQKARGELKAGTSLKPDVMIAYWFSRYKLLLSFSRV